jgi:hypothetical protein
MEQSEPLPEGEWNLDENDRVGMTQYRLQDLPQWAKEQLYSLSPQQHKHRKQ